MQDLHTENYKTMLRESKLSREMDCKTIFPKLIYRFPKLGSTGSQIDLQVPKFQMPFFFFPRKGQADPKIHTDLQGKQNRQNNFEKEQS